jgi:hypothetical protein
MKKHYFLGIDPGKTGAVAVINSSKIIWIYDMPITDGDLDGKRLAEFIKTIRYDHFPYINYGIEYVHSMPKQGVASTFNFGKNYGICLGILNAFKCNYDLVSPQKWKKYFNIPPKSDKSITLDIAKKLYPQSIDYFLRKKDHNRADAILIATYLRDTYSK